MKNLTKIIAACLLTASASALADNSQQGQDKQVFATCPPASAFHHLAAGQPWALSEKYSSQGWFVMQGSILNWNLFNSLPSNTKLSVRVTEEGVYENINADTQQASANQKIFKMVDFDYLIITESSKAHW
jgi:hypothetical protein